MTPHENILLWWANSQKSVRWWAIGQKSINLDQVGKSAVYIPQLSRKGGEDNNGTFGEGYSILPILALK